MNFVWLNTSPLGCPSLDHSRCTDEVSARHQQSLELYSAWVPTESDRPARPRLHEFPRPRPSRTHPRRVMAPACGDHRLAVGPTSTGSRHDHHAQPLADRSASPSRPATERPGRPGRASAWAAASQQAGHPAEPPTGCRPHLQYEVSLLITSPTCLSCDKHPETELANSEKSPALSSKINYITMRYKTKISNTTLSRIFIFRSPKCSFNRLKMKWNIYIKLNNPTAVSSYCNANLLGNIWYFSPFSQKRACQNSNEN